MIAGRRLERGRSGPPTRLNTAAHIMLTVTDVPALAIPNAQLDSVAPSEAAEIIVLRRYARAAGIAMLLSLVFGTIGEMYLPGRIVVAGNAAATAANLTANPMLLRLTFAAYLVEGFCDIFLCVAWYILLRPVDKNLALLSAFSGVVSMVTFAVSQSCFFASSLVLRETGGMQSFTVAQRQAMAFLCVRVATMIAWLFVSFYGTASMLRGYLISRSRYLPKVLGILLMIGGAGFFIRSITYILAPSLSSPLLLLPMALAGIPLTFWLLFGRVRVESVPESR
jgi:hypothetical protein